LANRLENEDLIAGFTIGEWLAEPMRNRLSNGDESSQVEPKVMEVLVCLARHSGRTVTKDTFFEEVWEGTIVTEDVLSRCISELRRVLHDDAREPRFVETIRKTGYRLISEVAAYSHDDAAAREDRNDPQSSTPAETTPIAPATGENGRLLTWIAVGLVVFGSISLAAIVIYRTVSANGSVPRFVGPLQTLPYTSYRGLELDPALSPNGDQVAFAWDDDFSADFDIYLKQTGAESPLRLTDREASERFPAWSPDGLHLAFVRSTPESDAVFAVPSIGGQERKLVDFGKRRIHGISWSPATGDLAVSAQSTVGGAAAIYLVKLDSAGLIPLTEAPVTHLGDLTPRFSPDGSWLAFVRSVSDDVQDVYLMSMLTGDIRAVTADSVAVTGLDWVPNGSAVVFTSFRGYMSSLWRAELRRVEPEWIVTASLGNVLEDPSLARAGHSLTYVRRSSNTNVWRISFGGPDPGASRPIVFTTGWDSHPAISASGRRVAFVSEQTGRPELFVSDLDGQSPVQLTSKIGRPLTPQWSPDGSTLAFTLRRTGQADVYTIDSEGGTPVQLTFGRSEEVFPSWSADGRWLLFASDRTGVWEIWRMRPDGSAAQQVTRTGAILGYSGLSGQYVYFVRPGMDGIWRQSWSALGAEPEPVVDDLATSDAANWSVTRDGIYYVRRMHGVPSLARYDFRSGRTSHAADLGIVPSHRALSASADGMQVLVTQIDEDGGDIQMVEDFE